LDAQAALVGRAVAPIDGDDPAASHLVVDLAADATERTDRGHHPVDPLRAEQGLGHQGAGGAGLHAFAAGDAGALAHRVLQVEHDAAVGAATGIADHVVDLRLATGPHAAGALD